MATIRKGAGRSPQAAAKFLPSGAGFAHNHPSSRMGKKGFITVIVSLALTICHVFAGAEGSVISWGAPTTISGDSDVDIAGNVVAAFNMDGPAVVVNGVTFN